MQCNKCRGTGISPDSTPAMGIKCDKCEGGEVKLVRNIIEHKPVENIKVNATGDFWINKKKENK